VLLIEQLVDPRRRHDGGTRQLFDTAHTSALVSARTIVRRWPDSAETAVVLSRALAGGRPSEYPLFSNVTFMRKRLAEQLAFRGHFSEAYRALTNRDTPIFAELAYLDAVPVEDARTTFARWARLDREVTRQALAWWSSRRDTASLAAFARRATTRLVPDTAAVEARARVIYDTTAAAAHLALARGDSTTALRLFLALPDTLCPACYLDRLTRARLLASNGRDREAAQILAEPLAAFLTPVEVVFALDRARAARRMGDTATARECYRFVLDAWSHGDATLHAVTTEAAHALSQPTPVARRE
jgi:hypothetical protein